MSAAVSWSAASVSFGEGLDAQLRRRSVSAALEWRPLDDLTTTLALGAAIDGDLTLDAEGTRHTLGPGPVGSLGVGYRLVAGDGWVPFVLIGGTLSATSGLTEPDASRLTALDLRASVTLGEVFLDRLAPYLALRGFGGPIFWHLGGADRVGSDRYHVQLAGGLLVVTPNLDAFFEIAPFGERSFTTGIATAF